MRFRHFIEKFIKKRIIEIWKNANNADMNWNLTAQSITAAINKSFFVRCAALISALNVLRLDGKDLNPHNVQNVMIESIKKQDLRIKHAENIFVQGV